MINNNNNELSDLISDINSQLKDWVLDGDKMKLRVNFINKSNNPDPIYNKEGDSGFDLRANITEPITVEKGKIALIPTGLFFQLPDSFELQVRPRSGLAIKNGITVLNSPGTVDANYRGELMVIIYNTGAVDDFTINNGDRIAQAVISSVISFNTAKLVKVETLSDSERNDAGFGSTGIK